MPTEEDKSKEQKAAELEVDSFRKDLGPFVVAAETTRMAMVFTDAKEASHPLIFANDSFLSLSGYTREETLGRNFDFLLDSPASVEARRQVEAAFAGGSQGDIEICFRRKDGSKFWAATLVSPVRDKGGDIVQHFVSFVDVSKHMQEEEHLRFLLAELNHRTQNTLATVQAIAVQTLRGAADKEVVQAFEGRILALSKAHSLLGSKHWRAVGLHEITDRILQPFGLNDRRIAHFSIKGDDVRLEPKAALTLAMVFHELATNAAKYGALSDDAAGKVDITWQVEPTAQGERLRLRWQESGGPPVTPPRRKGFGSRLIEGGLARDLDGEVRLDYDPAGLVCQITMPVPRPAVE
ncbi:histidine kinase [Pseudolabrys sp. Root1462]|uniref:HWE histidine kinase domain-containing protein n=1 Tax=Pseudolabrys sp. Root1462 TaxID=1736466 RepID=UPI000703B85E|nr:HWE histidine kinase domain-containing protein [Pseudolabrys sp. Root1462]KQY97710.1 histidine kinase [Pseudolabrys sp. Root1462]